MRELIVKLEALKESKEWEKAVQKLKEWQKEQNEYLLRDSEDERYSPLYSEADLIKREISFIDKLIDSIKVKDKELKEALISDLEKSKKWRIDRLLWKTHEYKLEAIIEWDAYSIEDMYRAENWWIECFDNLPNKLAEELKVKEVEVEEIKEAEVQEQIDALSNLEI